MAIEQVLTMERQLLEDNDYQHPRSIPNEFITKVKDLPDEDAMELAARLFMMTEWRYVWAAVLIFQNHPTAKTKISWEYLEPLGNRMDSWGLVDAFSAIAGPAWREKFLSDEIVMGWTRSENHWWRRAALVCTVFINRKAQGGRGDTPRTIAICEVLAGDRNDMVIKGMSWALRDLSKRDPKAVEEFLRKHEEELAALVKREVHYKLITGVKNPRRKRG